MQLTAAANVKKRDGADAIVLPFWHGKKGAEPACDIKEFQSLLDAPLKAKDFHGKESETLLLYSNDGKEARVVLIGLGPKTTCTHETLRRGYSQAVKVCLKKSAQALTSSCRKIMDR